MADKENKERSKIDKLEAEIDVLKDELKVAKANLTLLKEKRGDVRTGSLHDDYLEGREDVTRIDRQLSETRQQLSETRAELKQPASQQAPSTGSLFPADFKAFFDKLQLTDQNVARDACDIFYTRVSTSVAGWDEAQIERLHDFERLALKKCGEEKSTADEVPVSESDTDDSDAHVLTRKKPKLTHAQALNAKHMSHVSLDDLKSRIEYQFCFFEDMGPFIIPTELTELVDLVLDICYSWLMFAYVSSDQLLENVLQACLDTTLNLLTPLLKIDVFFRDATGKPKLYCLPDMKGDDVADDSLLDRDHFFLGKTDLIGETTKQTKGTPLAFLELKRRLKEVVQRYQIALQLTAGRQAGEASNSPFLPMGILTSVSSMEILQFDDENRKKVHLERVAHVDDNNMKLSEEEGEENRASARMSFKNNVLVMLSVLAHQLKLDGSEGSGEGKHIISSGDGDQSVDEGDKKYYAKPSSPKKPNSERPSHGKGKSTKYNEREGGQENTPPVQGDSSRSKQRQKRRVKQNLLREQIGLRATLLHESVRLAREEFASMYNMGEGYIELS